MPPELLVQVLIEMLYVLNAPWQMLESEKLKPATEEELQALCNRGFRVVSINFQLFKSCGCSHGELRRYRQHAANFVRSCHVAVADSTGGGGRVVCENAASAIGSSVFAQRSAGRVGKKSCGLSSAPRCGGAYGFDPVVAAR